MKGNPHLDAEQIPNMFLGPALALSMWNPLLAAALKGTAQAQEGFATIASEWQDFVGRQAKADLALMQRLAHSSTPDQIWAAYADFWQKEVEDYGNEITTVSKLMAGVTTRVFTAAQSAADAAAASMSAAREAA